MWKTKYSDPFESSEQEYNSTAELIERISFLKSLLSNGLDLHQLKITIEDRCCPFVEIITNIEGE